MRPPLEVAESAANRLQLSGVIEEKDSLRYTPSGLPVMGFSLRHHSQQLIGQDIRVVECVVEAQVYGHLAKEVASVPLGQAVVVEGVLSQRSRRAKSTVVLVTELRYS